MKKFAFVFPGQGAQYQGMGKDIYNQNKMVRNIFEEASEYTGRDMKKLCFEADSKELARTQNAQPAIFVVSYAMFRLYMENDIEPCLMAGHSLGEITALACAGAIPFMDAIRLIEARGNIMQKIADQGLGTMAAVSGAQRDYLEKLCKEQFNKNNRLVSISNHNSTEQWTLSGDAKAIDEIKDRLENENYRVTKLAVSAPFHSVLMSECINEFVLELNKYSFDFMKYPVVSNLSAVPYMEPDQITGVLCNQIVSPVLWKETIEYFEKHNIDIVIELGPKQTLKNLIRKSTDHMTAYSYDDDFEVLMEFMDDYTGKNKRLMESKHELDKRFYDLREKVCSIYRNKYNLENDMNQTFKNVVTMCLLHAICTPNLNRNALEYRQIAVPAYKKIRSIQADIEKENRIPDESEADEALQLLYSIFKAKHVAINEQEKRFEEIYSSVQ